MKIWIAWFHIVLQLRTACARTQTFFWMVICLMGFTIRTDDAGVTSFVRAMGLKQAMYDRMLDFFHSASLKLDKLTQTWASIVLSIFPSALTINGRVVLVADGLKVPKEGRKMPGVKSLHQESQSNNKTE